MTEHKSEIKEVKGGEKYHAWVCTEKNKLVKEERTLPSSIADNQVIVAVEACGLCHSDCLTVETSWPGVKLPRVPGHEIVGRVVKVGAGVKRFKVGDRVGKGWHGGHCFQCDECVQGDFLQCHSHQVTGITNDGGYSEYVVCTWESLAKVPEGLQSDEAAPLLCAGITVFNSLRNEHASPGDLVAVQGIGGLGHLGIQFAAKSGFKVAAISSGGDKEKLAKQLGAHHYVDTSKEKPSDALKKLGGARVALATAYDADSQAALVDGLGKGGTVIVLGADWKPIKVSPLQLIGQRKGVRGWPSGAVSDQEDTLKFAALTGVKTMVENFGFDKGDEAYAYMLTNKQRFRVNIVTAFGQSQGLKLKA